MKLLVNGNEEDVTFTQQATLSDLILHFELNHNHVIIEHNGQAYQKENFSGVFLSEHDNIEILHFMGGG